jgi:O-methyltransferase
METGVWRGGASIFMRAILAAYGNQDKAVWLADSFEGLPKPDGRFEQDRPDRHWQYSDVLAVSMEQVKANFARYGLLDGRVRFLPGWFKDTLATAPVEKLSLLRMDGDMYASTMDALVALYPKLSPGGYLIVDDYGVIKGCRSAVGDYRREHGIREPIEKIDESGIFWMKASAW